MPTEYQNTTRIEPSNFGKGSSGSVKPGFPDPSLYLPDADGLWKKYLNNVLRGDTDSYATTNENVGENRTFSQNGPPSLSPSSQSVTAGTVTVNYDTGGGMPASGFVPNPTSPDSSGNIAGTNGAYATELFARGYGHGTNGSVDSPFIASVKQLESTGDGEHHTYDLTGYSS